MHMEQHEHEGGASIHRGMYRKIYPRRYVHQKHIHKRIDEKNTYTCKTYILNLEEHTDTHKSCTYGIVLL